MPIDDTTVRTVAGIVAHAVSVLAAVLDNDADVATAVIKLVAERVAGEEIDCAEQVITTLAAHKSGL